ncbi:MAG: DNA polymerase IV [Corallococcus sp.]|nr:DNA polymerase IV [Corallococcus sp.]
MDILHCDLNNFYASVECAENPQIRDKYIAVSGNPNARHGIILAKNTAAKQMGVKTGEAIWEAKQKCPQLVCLPPHYELYVDYSKKVRAIYERYTDCVESFGLDECWLDVTHSKIFGTPFEIAEKLRQTVKDELGLTISVGVSFTKTFAKLGSDMKKPDATTVISKENYKQKVWNLDVGEMLYIGAKSKEKLNSMGIRTLGELANASPAALKSVFGINGEKIRLAARGEDEEPVKHISEERIIKSVGHGTTTLRDMGTLQDIDKVVVFLSEMVATRLRRYGMCASTVHVDMRYNDLSHVTRQTTVAPTYVADKISDAAMRLVKREWNGKPLRTVTVNTANLSPVSDKVQASIFDTQNEKKQNIEFALDQIRKKFGFFAIKKASILGNDLICDKFCGEEDLLPFQRK